MRAAVFGATGGIGAALVGRLGQEADAVYALSRKGDAPSGAPVVPLAFDLLDEASIAHAAARIGEDGPLDLVIVATGALILPDGTGPEKSLRRIDPLAMAQAFQINTTGPALVAKHVLPLLRRDARSVFAVLSARVGSIGDNRLGGWYAYRASKAALNMLIRSFAIEVARSRPQAVVAALHPGTVATGLSAPFRSGEGVFTPDESARLLLEVIGGLTSADSGGHFAWDGTRIPD